MLPLILPVVVVGVAAKLIASHYVLFRNMRSNSLDRSAVLADIDQRLQELFAVEGDAALAAQLRISELQALRERVVAGTAQPTEVQDYLYALGEAVFGGVAGALSSLGKATQRNLNEVFDGLAREGEEERKRGQEGK